MRPFCKAQLVTTLDNIFNHFAKAIGMASLKFAVKGVTKMEALTTIRKMISGNRIIVPAYQRAYSWETPREQSNRKTHTDVFLSDLEEYQKNNAESPYYFGHFLFEEKGDSLFHVIDGQQRLSTIVIFLSALFAKLKTLRNLSEDEEVCFEDIVRRKSNIRFSTVGYDNTLFKDYVIDQTKKDKNGLETESAKRIVHAFDYFVRHLADKDELYLTTMLKIIGDASCTTHTVEDESFAIQMFIFQNNRGKHPSNLEVVKAQFMYYTHLYGGEERELLLEEIKSRFEKIYKSISSIDYKIDEDDVLVYTLRVYFNSLWESSALDKINEKLSEGTSISFIKEFSQALANSFDNLSRFFGKDERENNAIHSLVTLGALSVACPFIIKAYQFDLDAKTLEKLCTALESVVLRHRLIGTRADITSRINDVFKEFTEINPSIQPIIDRVNWLKEESEWWWAHWNNTELEKAIQGELDHTVAKFLLWKYENYLESQGKAGYVPSRFDKIISPELEHIAPTKEPEERPHGYGEYDEEFRNQYLNCLGNYLLLSKSHNCAVGNVPFAEKHKTYTHLEQQREVQKLVPENGTWDKEFIQKRKEKIIGFILDNC